MTEISSEAIERENAEIDRKWRRLVVVMAVSCSVLAVAILKAFGVFSTWMTQALGTVFQFGLPVLMVVVFAATMSYFRVRLHGSKELRSARIRSKVDAMMPEGYVRWRDAQPETSSR